MATDVSFGERLEERTNAYLVRLNDCTTLLPELFERYESGEEYEETLAEIEAIESDCDERLREITGSITDAGADDIGLLNTRINFNESALLDFYANLDVVANHTERIGQELTMMRPDPAMGSFEDLREMAAHVAAMAETLEDVVGRFIHGLTRADTRETLTEGIESIRERESRCDELRNEVIATAFADDAVDEPLVYREFAILLDELANAMEDLTDSMVIIASKEPGIVTGNSDPDSA